MDQIYYTWCNDTFWSFQWSFNDYIVSKRAALTLLNIFSRFTEESMLYRFEITWELVNNNIIQWTPDLQTVVANDT